MASPHLHHGGLMLAKDEMLSSSWLEWQNDNQHILKSEIRLQVWLDLGFMTEWLNWTAGFTVGSDSKESACNEGDPDLISGSGRFTWRREWQPTLVILPGESQGQRSLAGNSRWGHKEWDRTEWLTLSLSGFKWCHHGWASLSWSTSWVGSGCKQRQVYCLPRWEVYTEAPRTHEKMLNIISLVGKRKSKLWLSFHIH